MNIETNVNLTETIEKVMERMSHLDETSEEYRKLVNVLADLYKLKIEEDRKSTDVDEKRKDRLYKLGTDLAGIILPLCVYTVWLRRGFRFEETGTITSQTFRNLISKIRPTK